MKNTLHSNNMHFIQTHFPALNKEMADAKNISRDFSITFSGSSAIVARNQTKCYLHSCFDTEHESMKILENANEATNVLMIFGSGLGHIANYLIKHHKRYPAIETIVLIEPVLEVFQASLHHIDLKKLVSIFSDVQIVIGNDYYKSVRDIYQLMIKSSGKKVALVYSIPYRLLFGDFYDFITEWLVKLMQLWRMSIDTTDYFKIHWLNNCLNNLLEANPYLALLNNRYQGKPVLLVAAGPSLNAEIEFIRSHGDEFVVVAVGSAIGILNKNGIVPDFYFAIDASPEQTLIFEGVSEEPFLIYADTLFHGVVKKYSGPKFIMFIEGDLISLYILKQLGMNVEYTPGFASVALYALNALIQMGFTSIFLIGQDLAYSSGLLYSEGAWSNADTDFISKKRQLIDTIDINGIPVKTDNAFLKMKMGIEHIATDPNHQNIAFYNLGNSGLPLEGVQRATHDLLLQYARDEKAKINKENDRIELLQLSKDQAVASLIPGINQQLQVIQTNMADIIEKAHNYLSKIEELSFPDERIIAEMNQYANYVDSHPIYKEIIERMLMPSFYAIDEGFKQETLRKRQSLKLAESLRVCLAVFKIVSDLIATHGEKNNGSDA